METVRVTVEEIIIGDFQYTVELDLWYDPQTNELDSFGVIEVDAYNLETGDEHYVYDEKTIDDVIGHIDMFDQLAKALH